MVKQNRVKRGPEGGGMTPFVPTDEQRKQVERMAGIGLTHKEMATLVINPRTKRGIDEITLEKHFAVELERGGPKAKDAVVQNIYRKAMGDGPVAMQAAIFVAKCKYGWRYEDKVNVEIDAKSGVLVVPAVVATARDWIEAQKKHDEEKGEPGE